MPSKRHCAVIHSQALLFVLLSTSFSLLWSCLSLGLWALCWYRRIHPLSHSVLQGPVPLQTNEETGICSYYYTHSEKQRNWEFSDLQYFCVHLDSCSIISYLGYYLTYVFMFIKYLTVCACFISVTPTMLLLANNSWPRFPIQKLLCDGD